MKTFTFETTSADILLDVMRAIEEAAQAQFIDIPEGKEEEFADDCSGLIELSFELHGIAPRDYLQKVQTIVLDTAEIYGYYL